MARRTNQTRDSEFSVGDVLRKSLSENTRIAYHLAWKRFASHCIERKKDPFAATPEDVAEFLVRSATEPRSPTATTRQGQPLALSTIRIALAAINREYREQGIESPASHSRVTSLLRALGRLSGKRQRQVKALREHEIANILSCCDELATDKKYRTISTRDAALFAVGFAGALRRSEICALRCEDIEFLRGTDRHRGMFLHIRRSKTDQIGRGERIAIPYGSLIRPVERIRRWLTVSGIGPRTGVPGGAAWRASARKGDLCLGCPPAW